jgi:hypothetical protein
MPNLFPDGVPLASSSTYSYITNNIDKNISQYVVNSPIAQPANCSALDTDSTTSDKTSESNIKLNK